MIESQKELIERLVSLESAIADKRKEIDDLEKAICIVQGRLALIRNDDSNEIDLGVDT